MFVPHGCLHAHAASQVKSGIMQVQALRSVERYLQLDKLYVLGTNCVDNGPPEGLGKFLNAASSSPETVLHYEFMQVCTCTCVQLLFTAGPHMAVSAGDLSWFQLQMYQRGLSYFYAGICALV